MAHEIRIRELIQIHFCNGNQAMVNTLPSQLKAGPY